MVHAVGWYSPVGCCEISKTLKSDDSVMIQPVKFDMEPTILLVSEHDFLIGCSHFLGSYVKLRRCNQ